jgi:hypothetical protein
MHREWIVLTAISLPFLPWVSFRSASEVRSTRDATSRRAYETAAYRLWYESHQIYGCDPEALSRAQWANLERWCHCVGALEKYAACGLDSLSDAECELIVELMPKRYPCMEEFPAYARIVDACRQRLSGR